MKCESCKIIAVILVLVAIVFVVAYQFVDPPPPNDLKIATGREGGGYHTFALEYQEVLEDEGVELEIFPTAGSLQVLEKLAAGEVSVGLVQGGTAADFDKSQFESLGSLFFEPVWVFYRKDLNVRYLFDLRGMRVSVGEEGSGTRPVALQLLHDNGITETTDNLLGLSNSDAALQLQRGEIDAAFFVISPKSRIVSDLLENDTVELFSFERHVAYTRRYPFLTHIEVGEGTIDLDKNIPVAEKFLLSTSASLVVDKNLHSDLIYLLLTTLVDVHKEGGLFESPGQFPSTRLNEFSMNQDAEHYIQNGPNWLQRFFSFRVAGTLDRLKLMLIPLIAILIPLLKGTLPIYRWRIRSKIYRWYEELRRIDTIVNDLSDVDSVQEEIFNLKKLQNELLQKVNVPGSFMGEFYALRVHSNLILTRLRERNKDILTGREPKEAFAHPSTEGPLVPITEEELEEATFGSSNRIIKKYAALSSGTGFIPIPGVDVASLATLQVLMLRELFNLFDQPFRESKARSIISVCIGSLSPLALAGVTVSMLFKVVPGAGHLLSLLTQPFFAFAFSYAVGKTMASHLQKGGTIDDFDIEKEKDTLHEYFDEGKEQAKTNSA